MALWDGTRLEDFRAALAAHRRGLPYTPKPGMIRAAAMLRLIRTAMGTRRPDERAGALESIGLPGP